MSPGRRRYLVATSLRRDEDRYDETHSMHSACARPPERPRRHGPAWLSGSVAAKGLPRRTERPPLFARRPSAQPVPAEPARRERLEAARAPEAPERISVGAQRPRRPLPRVEDHGLRRPERLSRRARARLEPALFPDLFLQ